MKIVFAGTPDFARIAYEAIIDAGYEIPLVMTQPDRPAGRGMKLQASPVKVSALEHGAKVIQPVSLRLTQGKLGPDAVIEAENAKAALEALSPDIIVVAAYGLILPQWVLDLPKFGCINIHASLLPRWRGAAPIQRSIEAGDEQTGISIMKMDAGLDTGDVLLMKSIPIDGMNASELHDKLAELGGIAIVEALADIKVLLDGAQKQEEDGVTYAEKIQKSEAQLDWNMGTVQLERKIRAFNPFPGVTLTLPNIDGVVKVWKADFTNSKRPSDAVPGQILRVGSDGIDVATADGVIRLLELQKPGGKKQDVASFINGWHWNE